MGEASAIPGERTGTRSHVSFVRWSLRVVLGDLARTGVRVDHRPVTNHGAKTGIGKVPGHQAPASHSSQRRASGPESGRECAGSLVADPGSCKETSGDDNRSSNTVVVSIILTRGRTRIVSFTPRDNFI